MSNNSPKETLEDRVQKAILQAAVTRPESAIVIALTLLLAFFGPQVSYINFIPAWTWLLGGMAGEAALVYSSIKDPEFGRRVAARLLEYQFQPKQLQDERLQQQMNQALEYRSRIEKAIIEQQNSAIEEELTRTADQIDHWLEHIYNLAQRIDRYRGEQEIFGRDLNRARSRVNQLRKEQRETNDPTVKKQIETTLSGLEKQITTLESLKSTIQRAELQLETTLTHLGTIYSQTMLVDAKDIDSGRARRLRQAIVSEVNEISDVLLAMDEVYASEATA